MLRDYIGPDKKYHVRGWVKGTAAALAAVLAAVTIGAVPKAPKTVAATDLQPEVRNINLGTLGLNDPDIPADENAEWSGSYVYFGVYEGSPVKYRVLDADTQDYNAAGDTDRHTLLLDCDNVFTPWNGEHYVIEQDVLNDFVATGNLEDMTAVWKLSNTYAELNRKGTGTGDFGFLDMFSQEELSAIAESYTEGLADGDNGVWYDPDYGYVYTKLTGEKLFVLSVNELLRESYGYIREGVNDKDQRRSKARAKTSIIGNKMGKVGYFLRSFVAKQDDEGKPYLKEAYVDTGGYIASMWHTEGHEVNPAMNIDLSKVAFTGVANADKEQTFSETRAVPYNQEWRLTLWDSEGFRAAVKDETGATKTGDAKTSVAAGDAVTVTVTNVPKMSSGAEYGQLSAMLVDEAGTVAAYGKVADGAQAGELAVTIPAGTKSGNYTLKVFAETVNSAADKNLTDYASDMADIPVTVAEGISHVDVTGITAPKAGVELDKSAACTTEGIVTTTLTWKKDGAEVSDTADFESVYTAVVKLTATEGRVFADGVTATVNGRSASTVKKNEDGTLTVTYQFPETAAGSGVRNIGLGTNGIGNPAVPADVTTAWSGSYVYFGVYEAEAVKYRVLDTDTQEYNADGDTDRHTMLLDSDMLLFKAVYNDESFNTDAIQNQYGETDTTLLWQASRIRANLNSLQVGAYNYTNGGFFNTAFTGIEKNVIAESYKQVPAEEDTNDGYTRHFAKLTGEKIFMLSTHELRRNSYGYSSEHTAGASRQKAMKDLPNWNAYWMTRHTNNGMLSIVDGKGSASGYMFPYAENGVSPALNLDRSKILFVAAANENKADTFTTTNLLADNREWKLTVKDSEGFAAQLKEDAAEDAAEKLTITVTSVPKMSTGAEYGQLSALLVGADGTVYAYGKVSDKAQTGDVDITLPAGIKAGNYTLKVFAETVTSTADKNLTDYASAEANIPIAVIQGITEVAITEIDAPVSGVELDKTAVCESRGVKAAELGWKQGASSVEGTAAEGIIYTACTKLTAEDGYAFADGVTATVNGKPALSVKKNEDSTITVTYAFAAAEGKSEAALTIEALEFEPVYAGYTIRPLGKALVITNTGDADVLIERISIDNTQAFALMEDERMSVPKGETLTTWMVRPNMGLAVGEHKGKVTVAYNEGKTAEAEVKLEVQVKEIEAVDVNGIEIPIGGRELDAKATCETEGVKNTEPDITWEESSSAARAAGYNTSYTAYVTLTAKEGYVFAQQVTARMNYMPATSVRLNEDGTLTVSYTFPATAKEAMDRPNITIDYRNEVLTGFAKHGSYEIDGKAAEVTDEKAGIQAEWFGNSISIVRKAETDAFADSRALVLPIPKRPDAPKVEGIAESAYGLGDGKIGGTDSDMEYRLKLPGEVWKDCAGAVKGLSPAMYEVRYKATDTSFAGKTATVEVKAGAHTGKLVVTKGSGSGTYEAGTQVTIKAEAAPAGKKFQCWTVVSGEVQLADSRSAETTVTVLLGEAEVKAVYEEEETKAPATNETKPPTDNTLPPAGQDNNSGDKTPATGDSNMTLWLMLLMLASGMTAAAAGKRSLKKR